LGHIVLIELVFKKKLVSHPSSIKIKRKKYMFFTI
jgi:hypothetical protein